MDIVAVMPILLSAMDDASAKSQHAHGTDVDPCMLIMLVLIMLFFLGLIRSLARERDRIVQRRASLSESPTV